MNRDECVAYVFVCGCVMLSLVFAEVYETDHLTEFLPRFRMSSLLLCKKKKNLSCCCNVVLKHYS